MTINIDKSWKPLLQPEFEKPYFQNLKTFVSQEFVKNVCYPKMSDVFNAFTTYNLYTNTYYFKVLFTIFFCIFKMLTEC